MTARRGSLSPATLRPSPLYATSLSRLEGCSGNLNFVVFPFVTSHAATTHERTVLVRTPGSTPRRDTVFTHEHTGLYGVSPFLWNTPSERHDGCRAGAPTPRRG